MKSKPFAAEWTVTAQVFGKAREMHAHEFYETEEELNAQVERLKEKGITQVTLYKRVDGDLKEFVNQ